MRTASALAVILLAQGVAFAAPRKLIPGAPVENQLTRHDAYENADGESVHSPSKTVLTKQPDGATAQCGDGHYSFSHSRTGTCSIHGGVAKWLR